MMEFGQKKLYIAPRLGIEEDDLGNEIPYFGEPKQYSFSYMPTGGQVDYQIYGALISNMFTSYLPMCFLGKINSGDSAYLIDGENQNIDDLVFDDLEAMRTDYNNKLYCYNANYRVRSVQPQNMRLKIIFEKTKSKGR